MDNLDQLLEELKIEEKKIKPIKKGEGLIAYRKYLWALKFISDKIIKLQEYRKQVVDSINKGIETQQNNAKRIRDEIERVIIVDPIADKTKTGGRTISLPDIATVSLSKLKESIVLDDQDAVLTELGDEFKKVKIMLDVVKAKKHIEESGTLPNGASRKEARTLSIRFKK